MFFQSKDSKLAFKFNAVHIEAFAVNLPTNRVLSSEYEVRLAPVLERLKIPPGTFEKLTGIHSRYHWSPSVLPSQVATVAVHKALEGINIKRDEIRAVLNCSITRDYFEPATACIVHDSLGLPENCLVMDISNACLGFMNGLMVLGNLIESGVIKAGVVVSGEAIVRPVEKGIEFILSNPEITRDELIKLLPTLTLGSGAVAYVLAHSSIATSSHKVVGGVTKSASQFNDLCNGNGDYYASQTIGFDPVMYTESSKLISSAAKLGGRAWKEASEVLGWSKDDVDHVFCHQVGKQVNEGFYREMGLDFSKEFPIYREYGNLASAALPTSLVLGAQAKQIQKGQKIVMTGFGSGLNALFLGIEW